MADDFNAVLGRASTFAPRGNRPAEQVERALEEMIENLAAIEEALEDEGVKKAVQAGQIIEARAKEIITEKGHIVTGALRRSINTQPRRISDDRHGAAVGSPLDYAPRVESLEDGGYLNEAAEQRFELATQFLVDEWIDPSLQKWRGGSA